MSRAVIQNSDYQSEDDAKAAVDRYFNERNAHFRDPPRRAGAKVWGARNLDRPNSRNSTIVKIRGLVRALSPLKRLTAPTPRSADRARSLARVSEKREYFKCRPETIGDFAPKLFKVGV